ncbi:hypothetical protein [Pedobacter duraquae]|uniref:Uncharacterized protein n=1 Tax=Pedobacter duraquae TaxID=425511 RepID=A0A4R6IIX6_9SPHI|nr:hypothetical protein [Pedobacter duraquae]TDO21923.1 hypothetical protein CLV32_3031 [Pedobacter duraquae]
MTQQERAFKVFDEMERWKVIVVKKFALLDPAAFIEYGKAYIEQGGNIEFSQDYERIRKIGSVQEIPLTRFELARK